MTYIAFPSIRVTGSDKIESDSVSEECPLYALIVK
jgi:hypothetical protein